MTTLILIILGIAFILTIGGMSYDSDKAKRKQADRISELENKVRDLSR